MTPTVVPQMLAELKDMIEKISVVQDGHSRDAEEMDCLTDKMVEISRVQAVTLEQLKVIAASIEKIGLTVYGNGKPGLTTIVAQSGKDVDTLMGIVKAVLFTLMGLGITALFYLVLSNGIIK